MEVFNSPGNIFVAGFIGSPTMNLFDVSIIQEDGRPALIGEGFKLPVPPDLHNRLARVGGRSVILGIRPQHIFDADTKKPFAGGELIEATIEIVEPVGTEVIIYGNCGPAQLTACLTPKTLAAPHRKWKFLIDMNQVHLFDKSTGEAFR
jgi:multiple sugar transport system ATP-binding protein